MIDVLNEGIDEGWKQQASFYCLRTEDDSWQFLGADTGITCIDAPDIPGLEPSELKWHHDKIAGFAGRTVFMMHHQFVSGDQAMNSGVSGVWSYFNSNLVVRWEYSPGSTAYLVWSQAISDNRLLGM